MKHKEETMITVNSKVMPCGCQHGSQDSLHGAGMRVFNRFRKQNGGWRCTVCGREVGLG